jgi:alpha-tubulin suppressor-like RCC1 family protein
MYNGNLGHGRDKNNIFTPRKVEGLNGICVIQIACGIDHTVAITSEGSIYTWGSNKYGKTGHGTTEGHQSTPKILEDLSSKYVLFAATQLV